MDLCTPRDAVDKGLSAFPLLGPIWGFVYLNWIGCTRKRWMGRQHGWRLDEENVAFMLPLVDVMHVLD